MLAKSSICWSTVSSWPIALPSAEPLNTYILYITYLLLQAWRGYYGNVYFQPITVQTAQASPPRRDVAAAKGVDLSKCSEKLQDILIKSHHPSIRKSSSIVSKTRSITSAVSEKTGSDTQSTISAARTTSFILPPSNSAHAQAALRRGTRSATSVKRSKSVTSVKSNASRQLSRLDRRAVAKPQNTNLDEDMRYISEKILQ